MISIDTNILLRVILDDDIFEAEKARNLIDKAIAQDGVYISHIVLIELVWVLKNNKFSREKIALTLNTLLTSHNIVIGQKETVQKAWTLFSSGEADFSDYMIWLDSKAQGTKKMETFDKVFKKEIAQSK